MTEDIHSLTYAYVVGGLSPEETQEFEAHLSQCQDCPKEVAEMRDLTALLSEAVATDPPAQLRGSVLAQIAATPQDAPATAVPAPARAGGRHAAAVTAKEAPLDAKEGAEASNVIPIRRSWATRASALVAAAAVLAAVGVGGWALNERNSARDDANVASQRAEQLERVLAAGDVETVSATATGGGTATVVRSKTEGVALLVAADLPALPDDKVYQAWTIDSDTPVSAGTFESKGDETTYTLSPDAVVTNVVAVSVEPAGGSESPSTTPILAIDMAAASNQQPA